MRRVAVYAGTRNVYPMMETAAKSLLNTTRVDRVWFLIEDEAFQKPLPEVIRCMDVSGQTWFTPDGPNFHSYWTYMTLIRLALPEILADESRCLWLDCDTLCMKDIGPLFDLDMKGNAVAMAEEPSRSRRPFVYHNAGVCLMDLEKLRGERMADMIRMINTRKFSAPDQDVLNLRLQTEILTLDPTWNSGNEWTAMVPNPAIQHFAGDRKYTTRPAWREAEAMEWRDINASSERPGIPEY